LLIKELSARSTSCVAGYSDQVEGLPPDTGGSKVVYLRVEHVRVPTPSISLTT